MIKKHFGLYVTTFVLVLTSCTSRDFSETEIITENISFSNQSLIFSNSSFTKNEIITYYLKDQPNVLLVDIRDFFELVSPLFAEAYFEKTTIQLLLILIPPLLNSILLKTLLHLTIADSTIQLRVLYQSKILLKQSINNKTVFLINGMMLNLLEMLFSDPYINNRQVVLTRFNDTIDTLAELTSVKIGVQSTSASETIVEENVTFTGQGELLKYDTFNEALIDLKNGLISAVVMDEIAGRYAISQQSNQFRVMSEDFGGEQYGIGFRLANDTIRDTINDTLFDLIESGEATAISETWFSEDVLIRR
jgi:hypothetical protein